MCQHFLPDSSTHRLSWYKIDISGMLRGLKVKTSGNFYIGNVWKYEIMFHNKPAINLWLSLNISWKVFLGMGEWRLNLHFNQKFLSFGNYFSLSGVMWKFYSTNNTIALALSNYICVGKSNYTNWSAMSYQLPLILIPPLSTSLLLVLVRSAVHLSQIKIMPNISGFISKIFKVYFRIYWITDNSNLYIFRDLLSFDSQYFLSFCLQSKDKWLVSTAREQYWGKKYEQNM